MCSCSDANNSAKGMTDNACDGGSSCQAKTPPKLVSIKVTANATQVNAAGLTIWGTVKSDTNSVLIEATTEPNDQSAWEQINWFPDRGEVVPGHPNQVKLSRSQSGTYHIEASLGGVTDAVDVWVIWATVTIQARGVPPKNARKFKDNVMAGTEVLGPTESTLFYLSARGQIAAIAQITPAGINKVAPTGWSLKRQCMSRSWIDGIKNTAENGRYYNSTWIDDTSKAPALMLTPTNDPANNSVDQIFDIDGPNTSTANKFFEIYHNFRQWVEWNNEKCSDYAEWYFRAIVQFKPEKMILNDVNVGNVALPDNPFYKPGR